MRTRRGPIPPLQPMKEGRSKTARKLADSITILRTPSRSRSPPNSAASVAPQNQKLLESAEAMAKLSFELNIRSVSQQAARVEREMAALVHATKDDKEYREQNEERLRRICKDIAALRHHMNTVDKKQRDLAVTQEEYKNCQKDMKALIQGFESEIVGLKEAIKGLSEHLKSLPTTPTQESAGSGYTSPAFEDDSLKKDDLPPTQPIERHEAVGSVGESAEPKSASSQLSTVPYQGNPATGRLDEHKPHRSSLALGMIYDDQDDAAIALASAARRVSETIKFANRWNLKHQKMEVPEDRFCTHYFLQQANRDVNAARYIQRGVLFRIHRRPCPPPIAETLEEFCMHVKWEDIMNTVQELLVDDRNGAIEAII